MRNFLLFCLFFMGLMCPLFAQTDEPMTFTHSNIIIAKGKITPETPDHFRAFLKSHNKLGQSWQNTIRLTSLGGNLSASLELGRLIRAHQLSVTAVEMCASSCVYMMMGGLNRTVEGEGKIGVHQFYLPKAVQDPSKQQFTGEDLIALQRLTGRLQDYAQEMGVDVGIIALASKTEPESMRFLINDEMVVNKLINITKQDDPIVRSPDLVNTKKTENTNQQPSYRAGKEELRIPYSCNYFTHPKVMPKVTEMIKRGKVNACIVSTEGFYAIANCPAGEISLYQREYIIQGIKKGLIDSISEGENNFRVRLKNPNKYSDNSRDDSSCVASMYLMLCDMSKEGVAYYKEKKGNMC